MWLAGLLGAGLVCCCEAQPNYWGFALVDNPPLDGQSICVSGPSLTTGEFNNGPGCAGVSRCELIVELPKAPQGSGLGYARLSLYLEYNSGTNGNATFGPLSMYHNWHPNAFGLSDTDYSDTNFVFVTNVLSPDSVSGRYYDIDVTAQVAKDYACDGATPFSNFRFQVNGLQYSGGSHAYSFYFAGGGGAYRARLSVGFLTPYQPMLETSKTDADHAEFRWPIEASGFCLEGNDLLTPTGWTTVTNEPVLAGDRFKVNLQTKPGHWFFRLRQR